MMQLKRAQRKNIRLKLGLAGPSGSGKTYSALLLAKGLVGNWEKVAVIDSENGSASLYEGLGPYSVIELSPPFEPENFLDALMVCVKAGMEAVIIDSISHEWMGEGGILEYQSKLGGRFQDWAKATPRHRNFIDGILQAPVHVICCSRVKTDWAVEQNEKGKAQPVKLGLKMEQRDGLEYEFTVFWRLSPTNLASCDKDRTNMFSNGPDFKITEATGEKLRAWTESGKAADPEVVLYDGETPDLKKELQKFAKAKGITVVDDLRSLSKACVGLEMSMLEAAVTEWDDNRRAAP